MGQIRKRAEVWRKVTGARGDGVSEATSRCVSSWLREALEADRSVLPVTRHVTLGSLPKHSDPSVLWWWPRRSQAMRIKHVKCPGSSR